MASPLGAKGSVSVNDGRGSSITVQIDETPGLSAKSLSFSTWGAAFVLSDILHKFPPPPQTHSGTEDNLQILELGAGTGLVGISAAAIWKQDVLLTDLPSILSGLEANISANQTLLDDYGVRASCGSMDWSAPKTLNIPSTNRIIYPNSKNKPSTILAADTLYDPEHASLMTNTISTWLSKDREARAVLCYALRFAYIDCIREFWELMDARGLECTQEGRVMGREEWNEVPGTEFEWSVWRWKHNY